MGAVLHKNLKMLIAQTNNILIKHCVMLLNVHKSCIFLDTGRPRKGRGDKTVCRGAKLQVEIKVMLTSDKQFH